MSKSLQIVPEPSSRTSCSVGALTPMSDDQFQTTPSFRGRAAFVTLGCAKNQVDSEVMLGVLRQQGYEMVTELERADVAVVNTCGFLQSSAKESIDAILALARFKEEGRLRALIVAGCLVSRYKDDLVKSLPEVDAFVSVDDIIKIGVVADQALGIEPSAAGALLRDSARPYFLYDDSLPRQMSTRPGTTYVKVSEGCNRPCTFCIIPQIRGPMRSREIASILREIEALAAQGVKEFNLVAQDLTAFGSDNDTGNLVSLLSQIDRAGAAKWVRLLYAYPVGVTDELLRAMVELPSVCEYLDVPLQHASEAVLRPMQRPLGKFSPRKMIERIQQTAPSIKVRTTFIVGFPGETEQDIEELEELIRFSKFSSVGIFTYSKEEGTPSFDLPGHLPEKEKNARRQHLMSVQQKVVKAELKSYIGREMPVLIEGPHEETELIWSARTRFQAPEVDGVVIVNDMDSGLSEEHLKPGALGSVAITGVKGYDLVGRLLG